MNFPSGWAEITIRSSNGVIAIVKNGQIFYRNSNNVMVRYWNHGVIQLAKTKNLLVSDMPNGKAKHNRSNQ